MIIFAEGKEICEDCCNQAMEAILARSTAVH